MVYGSADGEGQDLSPEYVKMIARDEKRLEFSYFFVV